MTHVTLWSHSQQAFHVESVAEMLQKNRAACLRGAQIDYVPIYIGNLDDCRAVVDYTLRQRVARQGATYLTA